MEMELLLYILGRFLEVFVFFRREFCFLVYGDLRFYWDDSEILIFVVGNSVFVIIAEKKKVLV